MEIADWILPNKQGRHLFQVDILAQLHILGVNTQHLQAARGVGNADVDLAIETTEASEGWVDGIGPVGGRHDDHVRPLLQTVHQSQQLRHDTTLHLAMRLIKHKSDN